ncbi:hypothetical protein C7441_112142 [Pseudaminobacter salicylatoxidans]|uniref:Uncharacterized protein n=1 Tax=Pseudaminobacter salicylatoxidans TaxID=93369 RepID=A0A316BZS2_PSESE|nr:hypothetical protein [Pseudaminobacter salicylatoxidans]PWJ80600.1 hypothetical protein C7441_112142 [Pseudaminobacter salicylatoxidans]
MKDEYTEDIEAVTINRRSMFAGLLALPVAGSAHAEIDPFERVRRDAEALAASMTIAFGGKWSHQVGSTFALIQKEFSEPPR